VIVLVYNELESIAPMVNRLIDDHLDGRHDNRKQLCTLFAFELWHDGYVNGAATRS
jgi:hypothetical protein